MQSPFLPLFKRLLQAACCIVVMAACWAAANYIIEQYRTVHAGEARAGVFAQLSRSVDQLQRVEIDALSARANAMRDQPLAVLDQRIAQLERHVAADAAANPSFSWPATSPDALLDQARKHYGGKLAQAAHMQELDYLRLLRASTLALLDRKAAADRLEALRQQHLRAYGQYQQGKQARARFGWLDLALMDQGWPRTRELREVDAAYRRLMDESNRAADAYRLQYDAIARMRAVRQTLPFAADEAPFAGIAAALRHDAEGQRQAAAAHWLPALVQAMLQPVLRLLPAAALAFATVLAVQLAIKAMFYFVLAPLASRCRPVVLGQGKGEAGARGAQVGADQVSRVSQKIVLDGDDVLLVLPEFIQSVPTNARIVTKWLLDWSAPWTSLVAGLLGLSRVTAPSGSEVEISSTASASSEIALLYIPPGSAMVFKPRALVGVIHARTTPVNIARHWRLGSLHAWLTVQLRFLEFHGPVTLIVKGTRGVRLAPAGSGRLISQTATLGFSSNLAYSTRRAEPFLPYCLGNTALLSDRFDGPAGYYVYDETPGAPGQSGTVTRWISGWADTVLRIFGI